MTQGWISIHRTMQKHWIWEDAERLKAWLDLLLMANHAPARVLIGNDLVEIERGSFVTSQRKLQARWGWGRERVESFLSLLKRDEMTTYRTTNQYTYVSIVNYNTYQVLHSTDHTANTTTDRTTDTPRAARGPATNNNDNKKKQRSNNENNIPLTPNGETIAFPVTLNTPQCVAEWDRWMTYKASIGKRYKSIDSIESQLRRCAKVCVTPERFLAAIEFSIAQNYTGIFEERSQTGAKKEPAEAFNVRNMNANLALVEKIKRDEAEKRRIRDLETKEIVCAEKN